MQEYYKERKYLLKARIWREKITDGIIDYRNSNQVYIIKMFIFALVIQSEHVIRASTLLDLIRQVYWMTTANKERTIDR